MASAWDELLVKMLEGAPPYDEPLPLANRKGTLLGVTIPFLIVSWMAVILRFWVRVKVLREPGWDDFFVLASALCNTAATIIVCISVNYGLGQHMLYIGAENIRMYLLFFYISHSFYLTETALIKISLLLQYLRIFSAGRMRWLCIVMLCLVSVWGLAFSIMGWFPCFPLKGTWDRTPDVKCYGFGFTDFATFEAMFEAHTATNMLWDFAIFVTPLVLFRTPNLKSRNLLAMAGVFTFGALVVLMSVWRLFTIVQHRAGLLPYPDFTWWSPPSFILSCLEIDLAITCASIPIFWPVVQKSLSAIFVSVEVEIKEDQVEDEFGLAYRLEHMKSNGRQSLRSSSSSASTYRLTSDLESGRSEEPPVQKFSVGIDPLGPEAQSGAGLETHIRSQPKPKWDL